MCSADVVRVESLGGSTRLLMISGGSDGIAAESGLLFPFAMNLSGLSCSRVFYINYTSNTRGERQAAPVEISHQRLELYPSPYLWQRMLDEERFAMRLFVT